jgi:hypothetical protein
MKVCTKCKVEKSLDCFTKANDKKYGLYSSCKDCQKKYYQANKQRLSDYTKEWRIKNKEYSKEYYQKNKEKILLYERVYRKEYYKKRKSIDPLFKLSGNIRALISTSIKKRGYNKDSKTNNILGCTFEEFKLYLEKMFVNGMSWENYGEWHLDHIYPISLAKSEEEIIKLNHYTNFQPLWAEDNLRKGNRLDY